YRRSRACNGGDDGGGAIDGYGCGGHGFSLRRRSGCRPSLLVVAVPSSRAGRGNGTDPGGDGSRQRRRSPAHRRFTGDPGGGGGGRQRRLRRRWVCPPAPTGRPCGDAAGEPRGVGEGRRRWCRPRRCCYYCYRYGRRGSRAGRRVTGGST
ncbi:unnamed protein product, partial [Ectocarpus sp. 8 AP-2014]